jgi:hypothetical membrane protein
MLLDRTTARADSSVRPWATYHGLRTMFRLSRVGFAAAVVLTGVAMVLYPGGTVFDRTRQGYSFFENSFSDLGSTVAWNGQSNPGAPFELAAAIVFVLAGCICFFALVRVYSSASRTRWLARAGGIVALVAGSALVGTALTPEDRLPELHGHLTLLVVGSFPIATALLAMVTAQDPRIPRRASVCWLALTVLVIAWASAMLSIRPRTGHELAIPVTLQKVVGFALLATLALEGYEAERIGAMPSNRGSIARRVPGAHPVDEGPNQE